MRYNEQCLSSLLILIRINIKMYAFENAGNRGKIRRFQSIKSLITIAKH